MGYGLRYLLLHAGRKRLLSEPLVEGVLVREHSVLCGEKQVHVGEVESELALLETRSEEGSLSHLLSLVEVLVDPFLDPLVEACSPQAWAQGEPGLLRLGHQFRRQVDPAGSEFAKEEAADGSRLGGFVPVPYERQVGSFSIRNHACETTVVLAGDQVAFPEKFGFPLIPGSGNLDPGRTLPVALVAPPLGPGPGSGEQKGAKDQKGKGRAFFRHGTREWQRLVLGQLHSSVPLVFCRGATGSLQAADDFIDLINAPSPSSSPDVLESGPEPCVFVQARVGSKGGVQLP